MRTPRVVACLVTLGIVSLVVGAGRPLGAHEPKPSDGWTLHIDAKKHLPAKPDTIAHHYCKSVSGGMTECQLYDSDKPDARLVGVEVVVGPAVYAKFDDAEKKLWHYHKTEIGKVDARLPGLSTYGKIYVLWDPGATDLSLGQPSVTIIE